ncbi:YeeE/YedE family protein [Rodentibacter caecimuris]|uniref:ABC transporter permease n=1 Tax=Rodentibacter caecimuris TaxID=1796644 RepID=A0ABX3L0V3_9PAST|nr:ABC transporter permease [Rodentibacter heylii]
MFSGLLIGLLFGFLLQRGQFCFVSGFRQLCFQKNIRFLTALLIAVSIQSVGFFSLNALGLITIPQIPFPLRATLLGGFIFGCGMVFANCCGSGAWFRSAEGALGSVIVLICFAITLATTQTGALKGFINPLLRQTTEWDNIYLTFNISPWWLVGGLVAITSGLLSYYLRHPSAPFTQFSKKAMISHRLFTHHWNIFLTATLIGTLGIIAWLVSEYYGRNFGFGVSMPSANIVQYLVLGQQRYLNWGSGFVLGIACGSFLSAKLSGEFELKLPSPKGVLQRISGGILLGLGAALMGGCTVTNALVATAYFSWQGWLATLMVMLGFWFTMILVKPSKCRL